MSAWWAIPTAVLLILMACFWIIGFSKDRDYRIEREERATLFALGWIVAIIATVVALSGTGFIRW